MLNLPSRLFFLALLLLFVTTQPTNAQTPSPGVSPSPNAVASPVPSPTAPPKVIGVEGNLELDDVIRVEVDHLNEWVQNPKNDPSKLVPYLDGLAIRGNYPEE